jgi:hypothetical protein
MNRTSEAQESGQWWPEVDDLVLEAVESFLGSCDALQQDIDRIMHQIAPE